MNERAAGARRLSTAATSTTAAAVRAAVPLLLLAASVLGLFGEELAGSRIAFGRDTAAFYYPLTEWAADELRAGRLPLWMPLIFGGYPLLADGEIGALYPPNVALFLALPFQTAYGAMRALHFLIAASGAYALARSIGAARPGALVAAYAFGFGSFMVGHLQHDNIIRSSAWIPWLLLCVEEALRQRGKRRPRWTLAGSAAFALMCLGIHIQPVLLATLLLAAWLAVGPLVPAGEQGQRQMGAGGAILWFRAWLRERAWIGAAIVGLGSALAAAQLIPLYVLGVRSLRPGLVTYDYATSFSVSPAQVLTLIFPYMFHFDAERNWALWGPQESTLYVGVAPLVLALVALICIRTRAVAFFAAVAAASLVLSFGDYLPIKPYTLIWNLPGFGFLRAPARFGLLLEISLACLAALGLTWVERGAGVPARRGGVPLRLKATLTGVFTAAVLLALGLLTVRWALLYDAGSALEVFRTVYLLTSKENGLLGPWHVYYGLSEFARPSNARTLLGLGLLGGVPILLRAWFWRPRLAPLWRAMLVGVVAADLGLFAASFYPREDPRRLAPSAAGLASLDADPTTARVFVEPNLNPRLGANLLVMRGMATINGYSSLEPPRLSDYWWSVVEQENVLLDLFNIRYVLTSSRPAGQRLFGAAAYHPVDRLMSGVAGGPAGSEEFVTPTMAVSAVSVVSAVEGMGEAPLGTVAAEITLEGPGGESRVIPLLAGRDTAEFRSAEPGRPMADYLGPTVVWAGPSFSPANQGFPARLYGAALPVEPPATASRVVVRATVPGARFHLYGLGLVGADGSAYAVRTIDRAEYRRLYEDGTMTIVENTTARPRVFVVGGARAVEPGKTVTDQLLALAWRPDREILVEGVSPAELRDAPDDGAVGEANLVSYEPSRVVAEADLRVPGFLVLADRFDVGWRAWVDDRESTVMRANSVSRAVAVPAGRHLVTLVYDPWWLKAGAAISILALVGWLAGAVGATVVVAMAGGTPAPPSAGRERTAESWRPA